MSQIKFTATKLNGTGKKGVLKPDENGYYELVIGGLNVYNSVGEYYTLNGASELFQDSSVFMRRVKSGNLRSEVGHPKRTPSMSQNDYVNRVLTVHEDNVCCHIKEVWLDHKYGRDNPEFNNPELVAIVAKIKPSGVKGNALKEALDNPDENVCFSIRALTDDYYQRGKVLRVLKQIVSFDWVSEPGLALANKYNSPSLESMTDLVVTEAAIRDIMDNALVTGTATESTTMMLQQTLQLVSSKKKPLNFKDW